MSPELHAKILRRRQDADEYELYLAALEWDLIDPIVIETSADFKSEPKWRGRLTPYHHQVTNLITFCRRLPVTLIADDVGLGKTISAGLIMAELISRARVSKVLIVCPKLLGPQWHEELSTKFDIPSVIAIGKELKSANPEEGGAVITTYQSARLYIDTLPHEQFQMLVLDEAHKLRNLYGVDKPPQVATIFRKVLEERRFRFVLMLTATPIHNRLWDLYSLVDLLTVARGHKNPFGSEGMFARKYIADNRESARHLKPEARDDFRSVVYGYMSRVRRSDTKLSFPERVVLMHRLPPTAAEVQLIGAVGKSIEKLNRLAQISILQALASSPDALRAQLDNMAKNGTVPTALATEVRGIVSTMPPSAKLAGLGTLLNQLQKENPERWRAVIFTGRLETQTTIQAFLEQRGWKVGIINGASGPRNQETIKRFRITPPMYRVIVSTEAGSEGINLQVANIVVNFDLPWNPMIVEQRIGRVQRLASEHANVSIYNVMLKGTFEEYIVGRLMEKLQMASSAIGDIESLLEAIGADDDEDGGSSSFDEQLRQLVVAALVGKNVGEAMRQAEASIVQATETLQQEKQNIDEFLGSAEGTEYVGPRAPNLQRMTLKLPAADFALRAMSGLGAKVTKATPQLYLVEEGGGREYVRFTDPPLENTRSTLLVPGAPAFQRLVARMIATGIHSVDDVDKNPAAETAALARHWVEKFGGVPVAIKANEVRRCFDGTAVVRVRATVAHDSYERLVAVLCEHAEHSVKVDKTGIGPLQAVVEGPEALGVQAELVADSAQADASIAEFTRFYLERRERELQQAGDDERKRKKLQDDFTPRLDLTFVAADGRMRRQLTVNVEYTLGSDYTYTDAITVTPSTSEISSQPPMAVCERSSKTVPGTCLAECQLSHVRALRQLLIRSENSGRLALPEFAVRCGVSGKLLLRDEVAPSSVTGKPVDLSLLRTSTVTGKRAEPEHVGRCEFTNAEALISELAVSEVSGKRYRADEQVRSAVSGRSGHRQEFIKCSETGQWLLPTEGELCAVTGNRVMPGLLEACEVSGVRVVGSELERCSLTEKRVLKKLLVTSSVSGARLLEQAAVWSVSGRCCLPAEAVRCVWSSRLCHPDDVRTCELTRLSIYFEFATTGGRPRLLALNDLLNGIRHTTDESQLWDAIVSKAAMTGLKGKFRIFATARSPDGKHLAVAMDLSAFFGFRKSCVGFLYAVVDGNVIGRVAHGRRTAAGWRSSDTPSASSGGN